MSDRDKDSTKICTPTTTKPQGMSMVPSSSAPVLPRARAHWRCRKEGGGLSGATTQRARAGTLNNGGGL
eukprot:7972181-Alexandrium_andersonii.AAC.1